MSLLEYVLKTIRPMEEQKYEEIFEDISLSNDMHTNYVAKLELFNAVFKVKNYAVCTDY
jgi:hypothetical protein